MIKAIFLMIYPWSFCLIQEIHSAYNICKYKFIRSADWTVNMRLGGEMNYIGDLVFFEDLTNILLIADIASKKGVVFTVFDVF